MRNIFSSAILLFALIPSLISQILVQDIFPGSGSGAPYYTENLPGASVIFSAYDPVNGREIWRSDGSCEGTSLVLDIQPGSLSGQPMSITRIGNLVYFSANDGTNGQELWVSDGTAGGTRLIKDIYPGTGGSHPSRFVQVKDIVYFTAVDPQHGRELWKTDGTEAGTQLVKDIQPGPASGASSGMSMHSYKDTLFFIPYDYNYGNSLWKTDGTASGTVLVRDFVPGNLGAGAILDVLGNLLMLAVDDGVHGDELWRSDGSTAGTYLVKDIRPGNAPGISSTLSRSTGNRLYFIANDGDSGAELWISDGTPAGTELVKDIYPGASSSGIAELTLFGGVLYFRANDGVNGQELWRSSGTAGSTVLVRDIRPGNSGSMPQYLTVAGNSLYFSANDGVHGLEVWRSDGSTAGTELLTDLFPGLGDSEPDNLIDMGGTLIWSAFTPQTGKELWINRTPPPPNPALLAQVNAIQPLSCYFSQDGRIDISVLQGNCPYLYQWSNGSTLEDLVDVPAGVYTVTITDNSNQQLVLSDLTVTRPDLLQIAFPTALAPDCRGNAGMVTAAGEGGTPPYQFVWDDGFSGTVRDTFLAPGASWSLTVTDANGCSTIKSISLFTEYPPHAKLDYYPVTCYSDTVFITESIPNRISGIAAGPPYSYFWTAGFGGQILSPPDTLEIVVKGPGAFFLTTTDDANGCITRDTVLIWADTLAPLVNAGPDLELPCINSEGVLQGTVDLSGGFVSFQWFALDGGSFADPGAVYELEPTINHSGTYVLSATNALNGCSAADTALVTALNLPPGLSASDALIGCLSLSTSLEAIISGNNTVFDGWTGPNGFSSPELKPLVSEPGEYLASATDTLSGCMAQVTTIVVVDTFPPYVDYNFETSELSCAQPTILLEVLELDPPDATVLWTGPNGFSSTDLLIEVDQAGLYTLTASIPSTGCSASEQIELTGTPGIDVQISAVTPASCPNVADGIVTVSASGGDGNYTYLWSTDATGDTLEGLLPGTYTVTATDGTGCTGAVTAAIIGLDTIPPVLAVEDVSAALDASGLLTVDPEWFNQGYSDNCSLVTLTASPAEFDCAHIGPQIVTLTATDASGNTATATAILLVRDVMPPTMSCPPNLIVGACQRTVDYALPEVSDNCPVDPAALVQTEGLPSGSEFPIGIVNNAFLYTDPGGRTAECNFLIEVREGPALGIDSLPVSCFQACDGTLTALIGGGDPPFAVTWSNGQSGYMATSLCAGTYAMTVTDGFGCTSVQNLTLSDPPPLALTVDQVIHDQNSQGIGAIAITPLGGTPPYSYAWSVLPPGPVYTVEDPDSLMAGVYTCILTDARGCVFASDTIVVGNLVGVPEPAWASLLRVYPNPVSGWLFVDFPAGLPAEPVVGLYDPAGRLVREITGAFAPAQIRLDTRDLATGVYQLHVRLADRVAAWQVAVLR